MLGKGNFPAVNKLQQQAHDEVCFIARHAGSPELHQAFLCRRDVQTILNNGNKCWLDKNFSKER